MTSEAKLRGQSIGLLSMLGAQFILGMILNLYVDLPKTHPGTSGGFISRSEHSFGWAITSGGGIVLLLHVLVAIGLLLGSISLVIRAVAAKSQPWLAVSVLGFLGVIAALTNGLAFLGYDNDTSSFIMAIGFMVAATAYSVGAAFAVTPDAEKAAKSKHAQESSHYTGRFKHSHG